MSEAITTRMIEPALAMLGIDSADAHARASLCCVLTSTSAPHVIRAVDDAWCRTWEVQPQDAAGKTLELIAGPRSSNGLVGSKLAAHTPPAKAAASSSARPAPLATWVDCGKAVNYTTRSCASVEHHLVIGPVLDEQGQVEALVGVSRILSVIDDAPAAATSAIGAPAQPDEPLFASFISKQPPRATAQLFATAFSRSATSASEASTSKRPSGRFARFSFKPQLRRKPARPAATGTPKMPIRFSRRASARIASPVSSAHSADDSESPPLSPPERNVSYADMLAESERTLAKDELLFRHMLERTDVRIVLASLRACSSPSAQRAAGLPVPRAMGDAFKFNRSGRMPGAPVARRRLL